MRQLQPDIIAFQEAVVTDGYDQVADLLGASYHLAHQPGREADGTGPLVVSGGNWPLESGRRIDYVMVRCGDHGPTLEVTACERIFDKPVDGVWASDNFGVVADLAIPELSPAVHY
jgi:hypothetical protein